MTKQTQKYYELRRLDEERKEISKSIIREYGECLKKLGEYDQTRNTN